MSETAASAELKYDVPARREWLIKQINNFNGGINVEVRPEDISDNELIKGINLRLDSNRILVDHGYRKLTTSALLGAPRAVFQFSKRDATTFTVLITNTTFYNLAAGEWQFVPGSVNSTLSVGASATDTTITVADATGFSNGDNIGIALDNGLQHRTTINGAPAGNVITLTDQMPSAAAIGKVVGVPPTFTGTNTKSISIDVAPAQDFMIFANGNDKPHKFDGTTCEVLGGLPAGLTTCDLVFQFGDYTFLLNTVESGVFHPQRVRNCDTQDPENWTTGNAGLYDLYSREDHIRAVARLGERMIVYKERSVVRFEFVGSVDVLFDFDEAFTGEGVATQDSVVDLGDYHIFLGAANIYRYDGDFNFEPIGDKIRSRIFGIDGDINPAAINTSFMVYVEELDEVWIFVPTDTDTLPTKFFRLKLSLDAYLERDLSFSVTGFGFNTTDTSKRWIDFTDAWQDSNAKWVSQLLRANSPTTLLLDNAGQVYEYDYFEAQDDGVAIDYEFETKDFFFIDRMGYFTEVHTRCKGASVLIEYSLDSGVSWTTWGTITSSVDFNFHRLHKKVTGSQIRFRVSGSGGGFGIESFAFRFRPTAPIR